MKNIVKFTVGLVVMAVMTMLFASIFAGERQHDEQFPTVNGGECYFSVNGYGFYGTPFFYETDRVGADCDGPPLPHCDKWDQVGGLTVIVCDDGYVELQVARRLSQTERWVRTHQHNLPLVDPAVEQTTW